MILSLDAGVSRSYPGSGTVWYDMSGNGNNGTINSGEFYQNYLRNSDNVSNFFYIDIPDSTSLNATFTTTTGG